MISFAGRFLLSESLTNATKTGSQRVFVHLKSILVQFRNYLAVPPFRFDFHKRCIVRRLHFDLSSAASRLKPNKPASQSLRGKRPCFASC